MSVKRLTYLKQLLRYTTSRLKEMQRDWTHAQHKSFKDILHHADLAELLSKELLDRARRYQKRDQEAKKK